MRHDDIIAIALALAGIVFGPSMMAAPLAFPAAPQWLHRTLFFAGVGLCFILLAVALAVALQPEPRAQEAPPPALAVAPRQEPTPHRLKLRTKIGSKHRRAAEADLPPPPGQSAGIESVKRAIGVADPAADMRDIEYLKELRQKWILDHDGISSDMLAGLEWPPESWLNEQLRVANQPFRVSVSGSEIKLLPPIDNRH
jgi:hypothetical protein